MPFEVTGVCKYYSKYKYTIELTNEINKIKQMEATILQKMNKNHKKPQHNIYDHLLSGCIKISDTPPAQLENVNIILKISGIWETETECGITYKFIILE
jgi:hypothetical protein